MHIVQDLLFSDEHAFHALLLEIDELRVETRVFGLFGHAVRDVWRDDDGEGECEQQHGRRGEDGHEFSKGASSPEVVEGGEEDVGGVPEDGECTLPPGEGEDVGLGLAVFRVIGRGWGTQEGGEGELGGWEAVGGSGWRATGNLLLWLFRRGRSGDGRLEPLEAECGIPWVFFVSWKGDVGGAFVRNWVGVVAAACKGGSWALEYAEGGAGGSLLERGDYFAELEGADEGE